MYLKKDRHGRQMGGTLDIPGEVLYSGSRDELNEKLRDRDDEIDRLLAEIKELKSNSPVV